MKALLKNKQFWLAVVALIQTVLLNYLGVPNELWMSIDAILLVVIGIFTADDVAKINAESRREIAGMYSGAIYELSANLGKKETKAKSPTTKSTKQ